MTTIHTSVTKPTEPISLKDIKEYLAIPMDMTKDDALLDDLIEHARSDAEAYSGRIIANRDMMTTLYYDMSQYYHVVDIDLMNPIIEIISVESVRDDVRKSVKYTRQGYTIRVQLPIAERIEIKYTAGSMPNVEPSILGAIKIMVQQMYRRQPIIFDETLKRMLRKRVNI